MSIVTLFDRYVIGLKVETYWPLLIYRGLVALPSPINNPMPPLGAPVLAINWSEDPVVVSSFLYNKDPTVPSYVGLGLPLGSTVTTFSALKVLTIRSFI